MKKTHKAQKIIIAGAGISGLTAALTLAEMGIEVLLVDPAPVAGGLLPWLDHQFPNNHCGMCRILPMIEREKAQDFCLKKGIFHDRIRFHPMTRIGGVEGAPGNLTVTLRSDPTGIDTERCTGCGACLSVCPEAVFDGADRGVHPHKAIYVPGAYNPAKTPVIDGERCTRCGACAEVCPEQAIELAQFSAETAASFEETGITAVILASGGALFAPQKIDLYGMEKMPNVVTSLTFERMLGSSGPYGGRLKRPSDGRIPRSIAWLQCVGSRQLTNGSPICSSACCMFAVKEAVLAKEKIGENVTTTIFYMDMRTFGREYQRYRDAAEQDQGVRFVRCRIHSIEPGEEEGALALAYVGPNGEKIKETVDLVVLSTGKNNLPEDHKHLLALAEKDGVFLMDTVDTFKDIADAVRCALATVSHIKGLARDMTTSVPEEPDHQKCGTAVLEQKPCILVLLQTKGPLDAPADFSAIAKKAESLTTGIVVQTFAHHAEVSSERMVELVREHRINRILLATGHPRVWIRNKTILAERLGIPIECIKEVDIFSPLQKLDTPQAFERFVLSRLKEGLAYLKRAIRKPSPSIAINKKALVVGSGPAGLAAAKSLADAGVETVIIEKQEAPLKRIADIHTPGIRERLATLLAGIQDNRLIRLRTNTELMAHTGQPGNFVADLKTSSGAIEKLHHGAVVIATGGHMLEPVSYAYGRDDRIMTLHDLQKTIHTNRAYCEVLNCVVIIQCVDSRETPRNYCSRICCLKAIETALALKEKNPQTHVVILYRDIMTYGAGEEKYTEARKKGVLFVPFDAGKKPEVLMEDGKPVVRIHDPQSGIRLHLTPDVVGLSTGLVPESGEAMADIFGVQTNTDGFILEADYKWRPVDTIKTGIFVCGLARAPGSARESMEDGRAAAVRALSLLRRERFSPSQISATVRHALCSRCGLCIDVCPFQARFYDAKSGKIAVDPISCQGCGVCAVECPNSATGISGFAEGAILEALEEIF